MVRSVVDGHDFRQDILPTCLVSSYVDRYGKCVCVILKRLQRASIAVRGKLSAPRLKNNL